MDDKATEFEQQTKQRLNLAYEISDEVLESAAMVPGITRNYTLTFCSTPWTCPMSHVQVMKPLGGDPRAAASNATALL